MNEWLTAVIGLAGAAVGAGAAAWGARLSTRASLDMFVVNVQREDERWMREQRQAAYHAMIQADMGLMNTALKLEGKGNENRRLPPELEPMQQAAAREAYAALSLIELCGPQSVLEAARKLHKWGNALVGARAFVHCDNSGIQPGDVYAWQQEALLEFRNAARAALGYSVDAPAQSE
ncbi:hypothetical protein [Streptomyces longwoodensis]|uniref:hypothetical protein n=1 Tax=Streptomyces longwoodensis TaxID=68231 RepID=UPI0033DC95BB